ERDSIGRASRLRISGREWRRDFQEDSGQVARLPRGQCLFQYSDCSVRLALAQINHTLTEVSKDDTVRMRERLRCVERDARDLVGASEVAELGERPGDNGT